MKLTGNEAMALLAQMSPDEVISALIELRVEMLEKGEPPEEVVQAIERICEALKIDSAVLKRRMN